MRALQESLKPEPDVMVCWELMYMGAPREGYARVNWLLMCLRHRRYQVAEELFLEWDEQELDRITVSFLRQEETCSASVLLRYAQSLKDHLPPRLRKETVWDWLKATLSKLYGYIDDIIFYCHALPGFDPGIRPGIHEFSIFMRTRGCPHQVRA